MKLILTILTLFAITGQTVAQESNSLTNMYFSTIEYYFDSIQGKDLIIISDTLSDLLPDNINKNHIKFYSDIDQALVDRKKGTFTIYWINHKRIGKDTVDVNIGGWTGKVNKGLFFTNGKLSLKKFELAAWCGGTMGYIPTQRFVNLNNEMKVITSAQIIEAQLAEREEKRRKWRNKE